MKVRLINKTTGAAGTEFEGKSIDEIIVGIARLSSSREQNELFNEPHKLLRHCLVHGHWSVFSMANLGFEITTSRAIGRELLRHWSLSPQEISQRYKVINEYEPIELREQSKDNRQSSTKVISNFGKLQTCADISVDEAFDTYFKLVTQGVARECARMVLPECTSTTLIFNGKIRDWITTLNQRLHNTAQKECREVAEAVRDIFIQECPIISAMLYNFEDAKEIHILDRLQLEKWGVYNQIKNNGFKKL